MVRDAEKYKDEDQVQRRRLGARNNLESYIYGVKQAVGDDKVQDKLSNEDKKAVMDAADEALEWLEANEEASQEEYEEKQKELEKMAAPVITKFYQQPGRLSW